MLDQLLPSGQATEAGVLRERKPQALDKLRRHRAARAIAPVRGLRIGQCPPGSRAFAEALHSSQSSRGPV